MLTLHTKTTLKEAIKQSGYQHQELAKKLKWSRQRLSKHVNSDLMHLTLHEIQTICEAIGYHVEIVITH